MKNAFKTALLIMAISVPLPAHANQLNGSEIRNTLGGKRVVLETRFGIGFPLTYKLNGKVTGDGTGTGLGRYFAPKETGRWWIANDRLCQQFPTWYDGRTFCFSLEQKGSRSLIWKRDDGARGTARIS